MSGRGRPGREPTPAERKKVKEFIAERASQRVIAAALERSVPNLRKYFAAELGLEKKSGPEEPPFKITAQMREDVALMAACNEPRGRIAKAIGVGDEDLQRFFAEDLEIGAARYRLKTLQRLERLADTGNLGATKQLTSLTAGSADAADSGSAPGFVSKKAAAKAEADATVAGGGRFAPRSPPRLATVSGKPVGGGS